MTRHRPLRLIVVERIWPPTPSQIAAGSSVREMNDEFVPALSRDRLGDRFGDFSGGIVAKLLPVVVAHNPVAEIVVRNNVNSGGCHRAIYADMHRVFIGRPTLRNAIMLSRFIRANVLKLCHIGQFNW